MRFELAVAVDVAADFREVEPQLRVCACYGGERGVGLRQILTQSGNHRARIDVAIGRHLDARDHHHHREQAEGQAGDDRPPPS